jgi:hypothetical protein
VDQLTIDIEQSGPIRICTDDVGLPDFLEEGLSGHGDTSMIGHARKGSFERTLYYTESSYGLYKSAHHILDSCVDRTDVVPPPGRMFKKASLLTRPTPARRDAPCPKQGRSERKGESYSAPYVEPLSEARTPLADFFNILLVGGYEAPSLRLPKRIVL